MKKNIRIIAVCAFCILTLALVAVPAFADAALPGPVDIIEDTVENNLGIIAIAVVAAVGAVLLIFKRKR